jgi:glyoxylase-like metal-dependent hydrolase (beta-lactamase superfamily II)
MTPLLLLIQGKTLTIIYTHADWDHVWGTAGLPYTHARIIGHTVCLERFTTDVPQTLHVKQSTTAQRWDAVELIPPTDTFQNEMSLPFGSLNITLHHLPGHTRDSLVIFFPKYGILFMGDTVETPFPCLESHSPLAPWIDELQRWESDPRVRHVIPAHGDIGGREIIQQNIAYLQRLLHGDDFEIPEPLTAFYRETHQENLRFARTEDR